ncbi:acyltransferase [Stappia indica]|uniref:acyltransferase n=1 Tax=Stappia indica TaxID=538381 RepID=UPI00296E610B|nr:DapH/DapD/GlmU-related protein [Stappia indica]
MIAETARLLGDVVLGEGVRVEDYCLIGTGNGDATTVIGAGSVVRAGTIIYAGNRIGDRFQSGNSANIRENNIIGDDVSIGTHSVVEHSVSLGNRVRVHSQVFIPEYSVIEDDVWIGPNVVLTNALYPASAGAKEKLVGPRLRRGCVIGANVTILPGVTIGEGALIGAGSLVAHDIPAGMVAHGSPARPTRKRSDIPDYAD